MKRLLEASLSPPVPCRNRQKKLNWLRRSHGNSVPSSQQMELCAQDSRDAPWRGGLNESWKQPPCKLEEEVCKWAYVIDQDVIHLESSCSVKIKVILSVD